MGWSTPTLRSNNGRWMSGAPDRQGKSLWTPWQLRRMNELLAEGKTRAEIAAAIGRTPGSVKDKIREQRKNKNDGMR